MAYWQKIKTESHWGYEESRAVSTASNGIYSDFHHSWQFQSHFPSCRHGYSAENSHCKPYCRSRKVSAESRQRLRPWLESKIHSGRIPGLEWIDAEQTMFRMPWKHAGKQNWCEQDCLLFKEWAIHTGKFREGTDTPNWATWKTRLRCAFNKAPDIQEVKEKSCLDDENNPFRVYRLLPRSERQCNLHDFRNFGAADRGKDVNVKPVVCNTEASNDAYTPQVPTPVTLRSNYSDQYTSVSLPSDLRTIDSGDLVARDNHSMQAGLVDSHLGEPEWTPQGSPPRDLSSQFDFMDTEESQSTLYDLASPDATFMGCTSDPNGNDFENLVSEQIQYSDGHKLAVCISYSEDIFYNSVVANESGCRIYYGLQVPQRPSQDPESTRLCGPSYLDQIELPPCEGLCVTPQRQLTTKKVLDSIDRGLILEIDATGNIYATRLCCCRIFVAMPFADGNPVKLERLQKTKVFDYQNEFLPAFTNYVHNNGPKPSIQVHFGFGQTWSCSQPFKKLLVKAAVVNCMALNQMHKIRDNNNSVNIDSVLFSEEDEYDQIAQRLKKQTLTPDISEIYGQLLS